MLDVAVAISKIPIWVRPDSGGVRGVCVYMLNSSDLFIPPVLLLLSLDNVLGDCLVSEVPQSVTKQEPNVSWTFWFGRCSAPG